MDNQLTVNQTEVMTSQDAKNQFEDLKRFINSQMVKDTDFGLIPGTQKPSLWKPGAEKLLFFHGYGVRLESMPNTVLDWQNNFWNFEYKASIFNKRTGTVVAETIGSCNSREPKFLYQWVNEKKLPIGYDRATLQTRDGKYGKEYRVQNTEQAGQVNTFQKISQKRAFVGATLIACRAGFFFGQQFEEDDIVDEPGIPESSGTTGNPGETRPPIGPGEVISQAQVKLIYALLKQGGVPTDTINAWLKINLAYTVGADNLPHLSQILKKDMEQVVKFLYSFKPANPNG